MHNVQFLVYKRNNKEKETELVVGSETERQRYRGREGLTEKKSETKRDWQAERQREREGQREQRRECNTTKEIPRKRDWTSSNYHEV